MFKLIPFVLIILMISRKGNYFDDEDELMLRGQPTEYLKTNSFLRMPSEYRRTIFIPKFIDLQSSLKQELSKEIFERIKNSKVAVLVNLDKEEDKKFHEYYMNFN